MPTTVPSQGDERRRELASLEAHLASLELDVEFYSIGGAVLTQLLPARPAAVRPSSLFRDAAGVDAVDEFARRRGWAPGWLSETVRETVGRGPAPGGFLDLPHLKIFAPPAEYVLAVKVAALRADPTSRDLDDLRFILRALNVDSAEAALAVATRYIAERHLPPYALEVMKRRIGD
jgi:hypothetical protein